MRGEISSYIYLCKALPSHPLDERPWQAPYGAQKASRPCPFKKFASIGNDRIFSVVFLETLWLGQGEPVGATAVCAFFQDAANGLKGVVGRHRIALETLHKAAKIGRARAEALAQRAADPLHTAGILEARKRLWAVVGDAANAVDGTGFGLGLGLFAPLTASPSGARFVASAAATGCWQLAAARSSSRHQAIVVHFQVAPAAGVDREDQAQEGCRDGKGALGTGWMTHLRLRFSTVGCG